MGPYLSSNGKNGKSDRLGRGREADLQGDHFTMRMRDRIESKLRDAFAPTALIVTDDSHRHEGHAGARPGGETHFSITITSPAFKGQSRVDMHRAINDLLKAEFAERIHALAISAKAE